MPTIGSVLSGVLRGVAALAAIGSLISLVNSGLATPAPQEMATAAPLAQPEPGDEPSAVGVPAKTWSLRSGGWFIRVDGAEFAIPSLAEQTRSRVRASLATAISPYDQLILHHAKAEGFDWRLIAALMFEESRFDPTRESDKGAYGLMQVRPIAAEAVGADHFRTPEDNIRTGVRYLRQLDDMFDAARGDDRLRLILAAYNMGPGHVHDAQSLARRFGYDPNRWDDSMALMLPLLERPAIYKDLPNGFAKGAETISYVQRILDRYERYQRETPGVTGLESEALSSSDSTSAHG